MEQMDHKEMASLAARAAQIIGAAMMDPRQTNMSLLSSWASTVVMLADKLEAKEASRAKGQAAEVLMNKAGTTEDIATTLAAMGAKLDSHTSARVGDRLAGECSGNERFRRPRPDRSVARPWGQDGLE
jgi:hypothetical protein